MPQSGEKTILIDGQRFTCAQTIGATTGSCPDSLMKSFVKWGDNINAYVNSGQLGPLGDGANAPLSFERIAVIGLFACEMNSVRPDPSKFLQSVKELEWITELPAEDTTDAALLPFWSEATRTLCPANN